MNRRQRRQAMMGKLPDTTSVSLSIGRLTLEGLSRPSGRRLAESLEHGLARDLRDAARLPDRAPAPQRRPAALHSGPGEAPETTGARLATLLTGRLLP
jgi:hypothetical protein